MDFSKNSPPIPLLNWLGIFLINIFPLLGVIFWHWNPLHIVLFYWAENIVIGLFTMARILAPATDKHEAFGTLLFTTAFFTVHYGGFCYGHGLFILALFGNDNEDINRELFGTITQSLQWFIDHGLAWSLIALVIAHAIYFFKDIVNGNIESSDKEMTKPYKRMLILHIAIIAGGLAAEKFANGATAVMLLIIALRIGSDIYFMRSAKELI